MVVLSNFQVALKTDPEIVVARCASQGPFTAILQRVHFDIQIDFGTVIAFRMLSSQIDRLFHRQDVAPATATALMAYETR